MEPSWPSICFLDGPRGLPDLPKSPPRSNLESSLLSTLPQDDPRGFQQPSKSPPRAFRKSFFGGFLIDFRSIFDQQTTSPCYIVTLLYCYFFTLLLCYFSAGAVAGSQLCCAVDTHIYLVFAAMWLPRKMVPPRFSKSTCTNNCTLNRGLSTWTARVHLDSQDYRSACK